MNSLLSLFVFFNVHATDVCTNWFSNTHAKPGTTNCENVCSTAGVDMGTFSCPSQCDIFCKVKGSCNLDPFWTSVLQGQTSPFKELSDSEKEAVTKSLSKLPKDFRPKSLKAIVRSTKSDPFAPSNPASSTDEFIILFPPAFNSDLPIERILFHEMLHQLMINEWSNILSGYKKEVQWNEDSSPHRNGEFVEADGKTSAEEDLANNVEYYVFEPEKIKILSPKIFSWIEKNLKSKIKLEKGCREKNSTKK